MGMLHVSYTRTLTFSGARMLLDNCRCRREAGVIISRNFAKDLELVPLAIGTTIRRRIDSRRSNFELQFSSSLLWEVLETSRCTGVWRVPMIYD